MLVDQTGHRTVTLILALYLGACSTQERNPLRTDTCFAGYVDEAALEEQLRTTADCCTSLASLPIQPYPGLAPTAPRLGPPDTSAQAPHVFSGVVPAFVRLTAISPVFTFPQGRSRFVALDLQGLPYKPSFMTVIPQRSGLTSRARSCEGKQGADGESPRYVRPLVTFLDAAGQPIASGLGGTPTQYGIYAGFRFGVPDRSRFAVLHMAPNAFGSRLRLAGGSRLDLTAIPGTALPLPTPVDGSINGTVSSTGLVELHLD